MRSYYNSWCVCKAIHQVLFTLHKKPRIHSARHHVAAAQADRSSTSKYRESDANALPSTSSRGALIYLLNQSSGFDWVPLFFCFLFISRVYYINLHLFHTIIPDSYNNVFVNKHYNGRVKSRLLLWSAQQGSACDTQSVSQSRYEKFQKSPSVR